MPRGGARAVATGPGAPMAMAQPAPGAGADGGPRPVRGPARYGQLVFGPPGSGKTTYCRAASAELTGRGRRVALVNLVPPSP